MLKIPEIDLELEAGSLGGIYTTVEGLLTQIIDGMSENSPIFLGDSALEIKKKQYDEFMKELKEMRDGKREFTLDIVDPLANSWIYSDYAPNPDPRLEIVNYMRTFEENEKLGINDMVVDDDEITRRNKEEKKEKMVEIAEKVQQEENEHGVHPDNGKELEKCAVKEEEKNSH
jgi:zinc finger protein